MFHLVPGGQARDINLHVVLSFSLKISIAALGAADEVIVVQFLPEGGKLAVAGQRRERDRDAALLRDIADGLRQPAGGQTLQRDAVQKALPGVGQQPGGRLEQRGLAAAVYPQQPDQLRKSPRSASGCTFPGTPGMPSGSSRAG